MVFDSQETQRLLNMAAEKSALPVSFFLHLAPPDEDVPSPHAQGVNLTGEPMPWTDELIAQHPGSELRNVLIYSAKTQLKWHTNSNAPGRRLYFIYNETEGSIFSWIDSETGERVNEHEPAGWSSRKFTIPDNQLFWHTVYAAGRRISIGLRLPDDAQL